MESFYKNWLKQNEKENLEARQAVQSNIEPSTSSVNTSINNPAHQSTSNVPSIEIPVRESSSSVPNLNQDQPILHTIDIDSTLPNIIFEDGNLQLIIEKGNHIKQKKFRLEAKLVSYM